MTDSWRPNRLWMVGCGNMAGAMLHRWLEAGLDPTAVFVVNRGDRSLPASVRQGREFPSEGMPDMVMLGMKPQQLDEIAERFSARLDGVPTLISILAGVDEAALADRFRAEAVVRAMPNLPVALGKGVVALYSRSASDPAHASVEALMGKLGLVEWIDSEQLFDAVTALSGCGPAFVYRFIDAMAEAGAALGIPQQQAERLALATVEGAALLAAQSADSPATLADRVASPGGSTRKGLDVLDAGDAVKHLLRETLSASARRNAEMAEAARR